MISRRRAKLDEALDLEVAPHMGAIWHGSFRSTGIVNERDRGDLEITIRGGGSVGTLKLPFRVTIVS